ncbi:DNA cytosine methyltransferase, partial [Oscillospiraceae bacterium OttesenSCG-928-G22]|nr:DNA cytosine methyltransferase [Oscillospiraceae bacterium OttesenSCG-928-G22]
EEKQLIGFDGYNGDLTGDTAATLGVNCGMSTGRNGVLSLAPTFFAANQRDEVRDLHDVAGAVQAQPGMKQQTFVLNPWDTQQARISVPEGVAPSLCGADGGGRRNPAGLIMAAGFCAGAGSKAQGIGYQEELSPTLKSGGGNGMPSILCVNDQGGQVMSISENVSGTLRAQEHGHQPLVLASQQGGAEIGVDLCPTITAAAGMSGNSQPVLFESHPQDARYKGPLDIAPTVRASYGEGGNNTSLIAQPETFCIAGNAIDRQPHNGGNGLGFQPDISYTLTSCDRHSVFSQQRSDEYIENAVASTQSARQYKDATDLIYQKTVGTLVASDKNGPNNQYVGDDKCIIMPANFIRRLTPLECERLQGFPDYWTDIPSASDSARYKALGNSVAIPCVSHVLRGVSYFLTQGGDADA